MARSALIVLMALGMSAAHPSVRCGMRAVKSRIDPAPLRNLAVLEGDFRSNDRSTSVSVDFWTCCVAGFYGLLPPGERCSWRCSLKSWMDRHIPRTADLLMRLLGAGANSREGGKVSDFWIADVGLSGISPPDPLEMVKLLEISVAGSDSLPLDASSTPPPSDEVLRTQLEEDDP